MFPGQAHPANNQRRHPVGQGYPNWFRENVVAAVQQMTIQEAAQLCGYSTSTVNRFNRLVEVTGSVERSPRRGGQPPKLLADEVMVLLWAIINVPSLSVVELKTIVETASNRNVEISISLISRELENLGMSRKHVEDFSLNPDEAHRVAFWVNPPDHPVRPGVFGVPYNRIVDIDESGFRTSDASRVYGHSFVGEEPRRGFGNADVFNQPLDTWNVSRVTTMHSMFRGAASFNQSLATWDVSRVTDMECLFSRAASFNQPLATWNVSQVTNMVQLFTRASSFNQPLSTWDVSRVTKMSAMFDGAESFNQPLASWDTSQVTNMAGMFFGARSFNQPLAAWDVRQVTNMSYMFHGASSFSQPLDTWDMFHVKVQ